MTEDLKYAFLHALTATSVVRLLPLWNSACGKLFEVFLAKNRFPLGEAVLIPVISVCFFSGVVCIAGCSLYHAKECYHHTVKVKRE